MARFSEEEVETLMNLVCAEITQVSEYEDAISRPEYRPHLRTLEQKLENYYEKHYPEDKNYG